MLDYSNDPSREKILKVNSDAPFNAETPSKVLVESFVTATDKFFVRNHGPVPDLDESSYTFRVSGLVSKNLDITLSDLKSFYEHVTVGATLMCAGNRRNELNAIKKVKGVGWDAGAIGNATWTGVKLRDVLAHVGADLNSPSLHVEFVGEEDTEEKEKYGSSIPMPKASDPRGDVVLAWAMNGKPLTRDHGFPLRVVVPGYIGARSVKWLRQINILDHESKFCFQRRDYKLFLPSVDWDTVEQYWDEAESITELSVQSVVCEPTEGQVIRNGSEFTVKGYAISSGKRVWRVDVSLDGGKTWQVAEIVDQDDRKVKGSDSRYWSWTIWSLKVANFSSPCTIVCKAWDTASNTQPENPENIWNLRGVMNNAWHRVQVKGE